MKKKYIETLLTRFISRINNASEFALKNRVLLLKSESGIGIDVVLAGIHLEEKMIDRASEFEFLPGIKLITASAEDLIILKAFANRPQDWVDVESILEKQKGFLDVSYIRTNLKVLSKVKELPEILSRFDTLHKKYK